MIFLQHENPSSIFKNYFRKGYFLRGFFKIKGLHGKDFLVENHDIKEYFFRDSWEENEVFFRNIFPKKIVRKFGLEIKKNPSYGK